MGINEHGQPHARVMRDGDVWRIEVDRWEWSAGVRTVKRAHELLEQEAAARGDGDVPDLVVEIPEDVRAELDRAAEATRLELELRSESARRRRTAVGMLRTRGWTVREIAEALGISPARVAALASKEER